MSNKLVTRSVSCHTSLFDLARTFFLVKFAILKQSQPTLLYADRKVRKSCFTEHRFLANNFIKTVADLLFRYLKL